VRLEISSGVKIYMPILSLSHTHTHTHTHKEVISIVLFDDGELSLK
jgi:hypothetical protein